MTIEDQIADEVLYGGPHPKVGNALQPDLARVLRERIAMAIRKDRERSARILTMAPLDMSLEQLAHLILER